MTITSDGYFTIESPNFSTTSDSALWARFRMPDLKVPNILSRFTGVSGMVLVGSVTTEAARLDERLDERILLYFISAEFNECLESVSSSFSFFIFLIFYKFYSNSFFYFFIMSKYVFLMVYRCYCIY